jgi:hypothetical protein
MASALTSAGKDLLLDSSASWPPAYGSVHNVDAPTDNTTEPSGGSPAYARKALTWGSSSAGTKALAATLPTFDIPAGFTVKSVGLWTAVSGGTLIGYFDVTDEAYVGQGTYAVSSGSVTI